MLLKKKFLALVLLCLTGCAIQPVSLTKTSLEHIKSAESVVFIPQDNLEVTVPAAVPNSIPLFALIGGIIELTSQSIAEKAAAPVIAALKDYDVRKVMLNTLSAELAKVNTIKFRMPGRVEKNDSEALRKTSFDQSTADAVLLTGLKYRLHSGSLIVMADVEMYPKSEALLKFKNKQRESDGLDVENVVYKKTFHATKEAITAENIKSSLVECVRNVAKLIVTDLNNPVVQP